MADNPIKHKEIIEEGNPFDLATKGLLEMMKLLDKMVKDLKKSAKEWQAFTQKQNASTKKGQENLKKAADATAKLTAKEKEALKLKQQLERQEAKLGVLRSKEGQEQIRRVEALKREEREIRKVAKAQDVGAKSTNKWSKAAGSFAFKFNALGNIVSNVVTGAFRMFTRALRDAVNVVRAFDNAQTKLASVLGENRKGIIELTKEAKKYGAITLFTATQVSQLQVELSKLGLTQQEIRNSTKAVIDFATAVGADLGAAAKVASIAIKSFGLSTAETEDVVSTLAIATTKSALSFEDYETILSTVGSVAKTFGLSISEATAFVGKLRDAGFDASKSATAFRNILLNLADTNGALAKKLGASANSFDEIIDGLITLNNEGLDLNTTLQLTDKRSVAAFNQFLRTAESVRTLEGEISGANDALDEMVNTQMKSLDSQIKLLKSSWDGFILSLSDGSNVIGTVVIKALGGLSDALTELSNLDLIFKRSAKLSEEQVSRTFDVLLVLNNKRGRLFRDAIDDYDDASSDFLRANKKNVIESLSNAKLNKKEQELLFNEFVKRAEDEEFIKAEALLAEKERVEEEKRIAAARKNNIIPLSEVLGIDDGDDLEADYADALNLDKEFQDDIIAQRSEGRNFELSERKRLAKENKAERDQEAQDIKDAEAAKKESILAGLDAAQQGSDALFSYLGKQSDSRYKAELEAADGNAEEIKRIQEEQAKDEQKRAIAQALVNGALGASKTIANLGFPTAIPALIAQAAVLAFQIAAIKSVQFEEGGSGMLDKEGHILQGASHGAGGINPTIEAEGGEYFGIINKHMTRKYQSELPGIFESINNGRFHDVFSRSNIELNKASIFSDPYGKMIYDRLGNQANIYSDSEGNQVKEYLTGKKRIIRVPQQNKPIRRTNI